MTTTILHITIQIAFAIHALLIGYAIWRVWQGENQISRLLGVEVVGTLIIAVLILIALIQQSRLFIDVALGLGALGFIGVIALAKYTADQTQMPSQGGDA